MKNSFVKLELTSYHKFVELYVSTISYSRGIIFAE